MIIKIIFCSLPSPPFPSVYIRVLKQRAGDSGLKDAWYTLVCRCRCPEEENCSERLRRKKKAAENGHFIIVCWSLHHRPRQMGHVRPRARNFFTYEQSLDLLSMCVTLVWMIPGGRAGVNNTLVWRLMELDVYEAVVSGEGWWWVVLLRRIVRSKKFLK